MPPLVVPINARIPLRTKIRMKTGLLLAWCGFEALMLRVVARLAYDVRIGRGPWERHYVTIEED